MSKEELYKEMAIFATRSGINPKEAVSLPAIFERVAKVCEVSVRAAVSMATYTNSELGEFVAKAAREVSTSEAAEECWAAFIEDRNEKAWSAA
jgi:hypothetical protein